MRTPDPRGLIAVDKMGGTVLLLDPISDETTLVLDDFERVPHELLVDLETATAYVPIYGDGIHGRNPNPGHLLSVIDLMQRPQLYNARSAPVPQPASFGTGAR